MVRERSYGSERWCDHSRHAMMLLDQFEALHGGAGFGAERVHEGRESLGLREGEGGGYWPERYPTVLRYGTETPVVL